MLCVSETWAGTGVSTFTPRSDHRAEIECEKFYNLLPQEQVLRRQEDECLETSYQSPLGADEPLANPDGAGQVHSLLSKGKFYLIKLLPLSTELWQPDETAVPVVQRICDGCVENMANKWYFSLTGSLFCLVKVFPTQQWRQLVGSRASH